jgi:hypothetical protein
MIPAALLGLIPAKGNLMMFLLNEGTRLGLPWVKQLSQDPMGTVSRIGDTLVWN